MKISTTSRELRQQFSACSGNTNGNGKFRLEKVNMFYYQVNPSNAELILYKLWRPEGFIQFEIILNVSVSSF